MNNPFIGRALHRLCSSTYTLFRLRWDQLQTSCHSRYPLQSMWQWSYDARCPWAGEWAPTLKLRTHCSLPYLHTAYLFTVAMTVWFCWWMTSISYSLFLSFASTNTSTIRLRLFHLIWTVIIRFLIPAIANWH